MGYIYGSMVLPGISPNAPQPRFYGKAVGAATAENHPENHSSAVSGENEPSDTPFIITRRTAHLKPLRCGDRLPASLKGSATPPNCAHAVVGHRGSGCW